MKRHLKVLTVSTVLTASTAATAAGLGATSASASTMQSAVTASPAAASHSGWWYGWGWGWYTGWHTGWIWSWHDGRWRWWYGRGYGYGYSWFDGWHYTAPWCTARSEPANDGWPGDYDIYVKSNEPDQDATATSATDTYGYETDASGSAVIYLWYQSPGERVTVTVGGASCSTSD